MYMWKFINFVQFSYIFTISQITQLHANENSNEEGINSENSIMSEIEKMKNQTKKFSKMLFENAGCGDAVGQKFKEPFWNRPPYILHFCRKKTSFNTQGQTYARNLVHAVMEYEKKSYSLSQEEIERPTDFNGSRKALNKRRKRITQLSKDYNDDVYVGRKSLFRTDVLKLFKHDRPFGRLMAKLQDNPADVQDFLLLLGLVFVMIRAEGLKSNIIFLQKCAKASNIEEARAIKLTYNNKDINELLDLYFDLRMSDMIYHYVINQLPSDISKLQLDREDDRFDSKRSQSYNSFGLNDWTGKVSSYLKKEFPSYSFGVAVWQTEADNDDVTSSRYSALDRKMGKIELNKGSLKAVIIWQEEDIAHNPFHYINDEVFTAMTKYSMNISMQGHVGKDVVERLERWIEDEQLKFKYFNLYSYWILVIKEGIHHSLITTKNMKRKIYVPYSNLSTSMAKQQNMFLSNYRLYIVF